MAKKELVAEISIVVVAALLIGLTLAAGPMDHKGYQLPFGWKAPTEAEYPDADVALCDRSISTAGFPLSEIRPNEDLCASDVNTLAQVANNTIKLTGYITIASGVVGIAVLLRNRFAGVKHD